MSETKYTHCVKCGKPSSTAFCVRCALPLIPLLVFALERDEEPDSGDPTYAQRLGWHGNVGNTGDDR